MSLRDKQVKITNSWGRILLIADYDSIELRHYVKKLESKGEDFHAQWLNENEENESLNVWGQRLWCQA